MSEEELARGGVTPGMIRVFIARDASDLIADLAAGALRFFCLKFSQAAAKSSVLHLCSPKFT